MVRAETPTEDHDFKSRPGAKPGLLIMLIVLPLSALLMCLRLGEVPPLFFDEGWNLSAARNWIEIGHWGPLLNGKPIPGSMLSVGFPGIVPLAASFQTFGYGLWQARLPGVLFTAGALVLMAYICRWLFGTHITILTICILMLTPMNPELHAVIVGRMALGEMPAIFYVLAGYAFLIKSLEKRPWLRVVCMFMWGLALVTKAQVIPFLLSGIFVASLVAAFKSNWTSARRLASVLLGSLIAFSFFTYLQMHYFNDPEPPQTHLTNWAAAIISLEPSHRRETLAIAALFGLPTMIALAYSSIRFVFTLTKPGILDDKKILKISILFLSGSWYAWYVLLSNGLPRYLFPAIFFGSPFLAKMLWEWTSGFKFPPLGFHRRAGLPLLAVILMIGSVLMTGYGMYRAFLSDAGNKVSEVLNYIDANTPEDAVIECGDAELHFLMKRKFHYSLNRHPVSISTESNPDFVIVGHMSRLFHLERIVESDPRYRLVKSLSQYSVYKRFP